MVAPCDVEYLHQLRYGRYLVVLVVGLVLPEAHRVLHAPCVDDVQRVAAVERVLAPAHRLAVYRDHLRLRAPIAAFQVRYPLHEQPLEVACVDGLEAPVDGVVRRYAVGQPQYLLQLLVMCLSELLYGVVGVRAAYHGQDTQNQYVRQQVRAAADHPRGAQLAECLVHLCHVLLLLKSTANIRNISQQIDKEQVVLITSQNCSQLSIFQYFNAFALDFISLVVHNPSKNTTFALTSLAC